MLRAMFMIGFIIGFTSPAVPYVYQCETDLECYLECLEVEGEDADCE